MPKRQSFRNDIIVCLIITLSFLLAGAEYITWWLYGLVPNATASAADLLSEGVGYLFQVLGLFIFALIIKRKKDIIDYTLFLSILFLCEFIFCLAGYISKTLTTILIFGFIMNSIHGIVMGYYLTRLSQYADKKHIGIVFGFGYAIATLITYLLSSVFAGSLGSPYIFVLYFLIGILVIIADYYLIQQKETAIDDNNYPKIQFYTTKQIVLAAIVVFLFSFVKNIGFYFPSSNYISGTVNPVLVRCTYAIGLFIAGIINDKSRRYGSICCVCALIFPFIILVLDGSPSVDVLAWFLGYLFFGFFSVYRVVVFTDISKSNTSYLYLAGFGMLFGRIGDSTSSMLGICIGDKQNLILLIATVLFIINVLVYFKFYNDVYVKVIPKIQNPEDKFMAFLNTYGISVREKEILISIIEGLSNSEIAGKLFISESTVKFHIHNILTKTHSSNRAELLKCYEKFTQ